MRSADDKRRLPIVGGSGDPPDEERPPWHWSAIGAVAIFLVWLPLAALATTLSKSWLGEGSIDSPPSRAVAATVGAHAAAFAIACFAGGALVGRFGGRAGTKEAIVSGFAVGVIAWAIGIATAGVPSAGSIAALVVLAAIGAGFGWGGGSLGKRTRRS